MNALAPLLLLVVVVAAHAAHLHPHDKNVPFGRAQLRPLARIPAHWSRVRTNPSVFQDREASLDIDGKSSTIGTTVGYFLSGWLPSSSQEVILAVLNILLPSSPEEDIDYFELIKEDVMRVVGDYIDQHNMDQLEAYKNDLGVLLKRYSEAPIHSDNYPDKNTMANSLSTSLIANRFLVEAGERPQSMILHYTDIASIHILVLKDAADTYTNGSHISRWWQDLDDQLAHYIDYGRRLQNDVVDWRNDMMDCSFEETSKYDYWTVTDPVSNTVDECKELHDTHTCDDHCQAYQLHMNREVTQFIWEYMGKSLREWETLKIQSEAMAKQASRSWVP
ncbi:unnamed protein product [Meganyctiphanes norvegica]|uniref:Uncharacterized protein n=1 Tax=Meganyctiphanes norvegica TaxID=48144 RepID=A0AAV2PYQ8_MEGNR